MRDLEKINPSFAHPSRFISLMAWLPFLLSGLGMVLANGAAEPVPLFANPIWVGCFVTMLASSSMLLIPKVFKWGWRAQNFGIGIILLGSMMMLGGIPWLCFLIYGSLPVALRLIFFILYFSVLIFWAWRYLSKYKQLVERGNEFPKLYQEDDDVVYYLQRTDKRILAYQAAPRNFPPLIFIIIVIVVSFAVVFNSEIISAKLGLPFVHIFLGIIAIPLDMMTAAIVARGCLVYFFYPRRIYGATGKRVYVDMAS